MCEQPGWLNPGQVPEKEKVLAVVLQHVWFDAIAAGKKTTEMRANGSFWRKRNQDATHISFVRAMSSVKLPKKKIDTVDVLPATESPNFGGPEPGTSSFESLFGSHEEIIVVHFQPYTKEEVADVLPAIGEKGTKKALKTFRDMASEQELKNAKEMNPKDLFKPDSDRPMRLTNKEVEEMKRKPIQFPQNLLTSFIQTAWTCAKENEFMGWITGKLEPMKGGGKKGKDVAKTEPMVVVNGLFIPKQQADQTNVWEAADSDPPFQMVEFMQESESVVVGWIHSHPTFEAFLSSIDMHTQYSLQKDLPQAFAIVVDQKKDCRVMRLSAAGMETIAACSEHPGTFHEHEGDHSMLVDDIPFYIHAHGKLSRLHFHDQNQFMERRDLIIFQIEES